MTGTTVGVLIAVIGAAGVYLLYTAAVFGWRGVGPRVARRRGRHAAQWLAQAGLSDVRVPDLVMRAALVALGTAAAAFIVFGGVLPPIAAGLCAAFAPVVSARNRRRRRREQAAEAWPRLIEETRLQITTLGRSVPQALFTVGGRAPSELAPAFAAAQREWLLGADFERALAVLKTQLADATADVVCETLLVAHEVGGSDIGRRLTALAEDRVLDLHGRKDAAAKQAGARFARRFVLAVPLGMALAGLTIGTGRAAYQSPVGQLLVVAGIALIALCWAWAGRLMRLPREQRVAVGP